MRILTKFFLSLGFGTLILSSCNKSNDVPANTDLSNQSVNLHRYGLKEMQASEWANVPVFSKEALMASSTNKTVYSGPSYTSYLIKAPQIRDQGQIGSCTGFCGAESDEILYYYKNNSVTPVTNFPLANAITLAQQNAIPNTSEAAAFNNSPSAALSPLFLYFVERVVINKGTIGSDPGANMVNIGQALQGLSSNSGTGKALTYGGYTFAGIPNEANYPYPLSVNSNGYNVAGTTSAIYTNYPYNYFNYGATTIPVAPNNFTIGTQSGGTGSTGTTGTLTNHGYYLINSTGSALVSDVKTALLNNKPVMMGFNVYDNTKTYAYFEGLNKTSYTYNPLSSSGRLATGVRLLGGHAVPIIGYVDDASQSGGGAFIVQNSWGTPWGNNGYFLLPYSVIQSTTVVPSGSLYVMII